MSQDGLTRTKTPIETSARALQILRAADELLAERGHDGVSMRDVAQRAGVNKALIFYYFGSRSKLFEKVLERYFRNHARALARAFNATGDVRTRVHHAVDTYLDFVEKNDLFSRLVQQEIARQEPQLPLIRDNLRTLFEMMREELDGVLPSEGALAVRHFFMTLASVTIHCSTYAEALADAWGVDPYSDQARRERREHIRWLTDTVVDRLVTERAGG
ncbi:MAG: hypothetical protein CSA66_06860 [Proteobacteria bacterium]|nr:MAG: hypothetical protein CSA66_06860 [Pseudomonadota bacterium]